MEATKKLYDIDSHLTTFEATVLTCEPIGEFYQVTLDQTAFFPEGGGQAADSGEINGEEVLDVQEKGEIIYHKTAQSFAIGQKITGVINWQKRFSNMQQHTGEHIFSGLVHRLHGLDNIGFHMGSEAVTMDFNGLLTMEDLLKIEWYANEAVIKNIEVKAYYPEQAELSELEYRSKISLQNGVRIVIIEGYDSCACCAPHVFRTGEIGLIKILGVQKYKGGCRVSMLCGFRALDDFNQKLSSAVSISQALSAKQGEIANAVKRCKEENFLLKAKWSALNEKRIQRILTEQVETEDSVLFIEEDFSSNELRKLVNAIVDKTNGSCVAFSNSDDSGRYFYIIGSKKEDAREYANYFNEQFSGKGGGNAVQVQGSLYATKQEIVEAWEKRVIS